MSWSRRPRAAVLVAVTAESDQKSVLLSGDRVGGGIPDTLQICSSWEHRVRISAASSVMVGDIFFACTLNSILWIQQTMGGEMDGGILMSDGINTLLQGEWSAASGTRASHVVSTCHPL